MIRLALLSLALWALPAAGAPSPVMVVPLEGAIGPASADFVRRSLQRAERAGAQLVVLQIDTPGGLDTSMRQIIKDILASPVPVAAFVAPAGSRAASAGTFIMYASHHAAMAPGTNLGAASPVSIGAPQQPQQPEQADEKGKKGKKAKPSDSGDTMTRKVTNDAVAYIRGLAKMRNRNADWAERAVREGVSLPAEDALRLKVIDLMAQDVPDLLKKLDGKGELRTAAAPVVEVELDWRTRVLGVITNPSIAYLMILIGIYALIFEFMNPGLILPGVVGAICLLLALYAFHLLPVNYAGLALIILGIVFMIAEAFLPSFGALGAGGLIAFIIGSVILMEDVEVPEFQIPYTLIGGVAVASGLFLLFVVGMLVRGRTAPVVTGREQLLGAFGEALEDFERDGWARVHGENWRVRSPAPVRKGQRLRVTAMDGLLLMVNPEQGDKA